MDTAEQSRQVAKVLSVPSFAWCTGWQEARWERTRQAEGLGSGETLLGSCLGDKSPGGQPPHSSPRTCPLRPSPAASGPRRALAGQGTALREEMENAGCGTALRVTAFLSQAPFCRDLLETTGAAAGVATHSARGWSRQLLSRCASVTPDACTCRGQDRRQVLPFRQGPHSHQPLAGT